MSLTAILTTVLLGLIRPPSTARFASLDPERVAILADDLALAAELHDGAPFKGPDRVLKLALAGAAVAAHESNLARRVVDCEYHGDPRLGDQPGQGRSITAFQLFKGFAWDGHTREELCPTGPLAAYVALKLLGRQGGCSTPQSMFAGYASGDCRRGSRAAERQCRIWERAATRAGLHVACAGRL